MIDISKQEWKFVAWITLAVIVITFVPLLYGYFNTPDGKIFLFNPSVNYYDRQVYYSQIGQIAAGDYFFKDLFTSEAQPIGIFNPLWFLVGLAAKLFSLPPAIAFHAARFLLIPVFMAVAYCFI